MKPIIIFVVLAALALTLSTQNIMGQHAFALQHFFNCVTEQSNKDGGDHNLTAQQVLDCFDKEFPNNDHSIHSFSHSTSTTDTIINGHHFHSEIIN